MKIVRKSTNCALCTGRALLNQDEEGSGTVLGIAVLSAVALCVLAIVWSSSYLSCQARARTVADQVALASAYNIHIGTGAGETGLKKGAGSLVVSSACEKSFTHIADSSLELESCMVNGEDVQVKISGSPSLPFLPRVSVSSRAGPSDCVPQNR